LVTESWQGKEQYHNLIKKCPRMMIMEI